MSLEGISPYGDPAPVTRIFGWLTLFGLAAFMINNVLVVYYGFPGAVSGNILQIAIYVVAAVAAIALVLTTRDRALRYDARRISNFNAYLVRAFFFTVLLVGIADAAISFLRVEGFLPMLFPEAWAKGMQRAAWVGVYVHVPLMVVSFIIALFSRTLGFPWLALLIVVAELLIVITRFIFSYEQALMADLVRYWYAALFLFASAFTLLDEGHVRVDVFYAGFGATKKGFVNAVGTILLGMTTAWVIIVIGFAGKQSIINSPVVNFEVSQAGPTGMYTKYQMAAFIGIFAITMLIQFVSYLFEAVADRRNEPGRRDIAPVSH